MKYLRTLFSLLIMIGLAGTLAPAEEGMWMPHQMKDLSLKDKGLIMNPENLYREDGTGLMSAVIYLGGGTGEFVSSGGLILTNHHVAFGALQRAATKEKDYLENGFLAWTKKEEIPAKGYIADVLMGYSEVTDKILSVLKPSMSPRERYDAIDKATKKVIADAEREGKDIRASVANMYSGNKYYLFQFKRIKDIRIVYAPPQDLGTFGGDIDNWMWPRHTCDFTFLRAYVSPDNVGVDFSKDNIPYQPKSFLKISLEGFKEGEFSFVMGYPGRTFRNNTLSELRFDLDNMKKRMDTFKDVLHFFEEAGRNSREIQIKYASIVQGLNNVLKNYQGKFEGIEKIALLDIKDKQEKGFLDWVNQSSERKRKYGKALMQIDDFMKKYEKHSLKSSLLGQIVNPYSSSALLAQAYTIYRAVTERQKSDLDREPDYQDRNLPLIKMQIQLAERGYHFETDRAFLKHRLRRLSEKPEELTPTALKDILSQKSEKAIEDFVDNLYENTILADPKKRLELLELKPDLLLSQNDPFIHLAAKLEEEMKVLREESKSLGQEQLDLKKTYLEALLIQKQGRIAPDANSTIRFTYGFFEGYSPRDAVYFSPQTTLTGLIEKDRGEFPFHVPEKVKTLHKEKDFGPYVDQKLKDIPTCFLNTTSITGGNSGSPTLNAKGEQIGIIFDMTYESVTADYYEIPELQRSISVDIRFVLFITEKFSGAIHITKELGF